MENIEIISDLDGTLLKSSLVLSHAKYLIENSIISDDGSCDAWLLDTKNEHLIVAVAENYRAKIIGMKVEDLHVVDFVRKFCNNIETFNLNIYSELIRKPRSVLIITGSADFLAKELGREMGFKVIATEYLTDDNGCLTGKVNGMFSEKQKERYLTKELSKLKKKTSLIGYGDTFSDNGIFKFCDKKILVYPTISTMRKFLEEGIKFDKIYN